MNKKILIIAGPTASGKSQAALDIAEEIPCVIINADSKQVYKEIPTITAQPNKKERLKTKHELYSIISVKENFSVNNWLLYTQQAITQAFKEELMPILVGGTGLYYLALINGLSSIPDINPTIRQYVRTKLDKEGITALYEELKLCDPTQANKLKPNDKQRIARSLEVFKQTGKSILYWQQQKTTPFFSQDMFVKYFLNPPRQQLYKNADDRFTKMVENNVIAEARKIRDMQLDPNLPAAKAHGLPEIIKYLEGNLTLEQAINIAQKNTRNYIKRQITWFTHQLPEFQEINSTFLLVDKIKNSVFT